MRSLHISPASDTSDTQFFFHSITRQAGTDGKEAEWEKETWLWSLCVPACETVCKKIPEGQINLISPVGILYPHTFSHP